MDSPMSGPQDTAKDLANKPVDYLISAMKATLGSVPVAGSFLAELVGTLVPQQRVDRLVKFSLELEARMSSLDREMVRAKLSDENFTDLFEETATHAVRAVSEERKQYLAALLVNGIDATKISYIESKHLLRLLGELNDIEIIWLRFYLDRSRDGDTEFRNKHADTLTIIPPTIGADQSTRDKYTIGQSYKNHLADLGLLNPVYKKKSFNSNMPEFDSNGRMVVSYYELTGLGAMLLRQISLDVDDPV